MPSFKSHQIGIETNEAEASPRFIFTLNRTKLELKLK